MKTLSIKLGQIPPKETIDRLSKLKDEDIIYDNDCPKMTSAMEKAFSTAVAHRNRTKRKVQ